MAISTTNKETNMSMTETTTDLTPEECYEESAKALRDNNVDAANHWRLLGDSVATTQRLSQGR